MSTETWITYNTIDLGRNYTLIIYFSSNRSLWKYRVFNVDTGVSFESDVTLLTYEGALNHALEAVISILGKSVGYIAKRVYNNNYEVKIIFTNLSSSEVEAELIIRTNYHTYNDNMVILRVLQALCERT